VAQRTLEQPKPWTFEQASGTLSKGNFRDISEEGFPPDDDGIVIDPPEGPGNAREEEAEEEETPDVEMLSVLSPAKSASANRASVHMSKESPTNAYCLWSRMLCIYETSR
jgi:hypothetical protein